MPQNSDDQDRKDAKFVDASESTSSECSEKFDACVSDGVMGGTHAAADATQVNYDPADVPNDFGRYQIEKELGRGGMAAVYLAHDGQLDRKVALKIPFFRSDDEVAAVERFRREARAMATVQHANLCPIYDVGQFKQWHFLTMAFIDGQPLAKQMKDSVFSVIQTAKLLRTVALALQEAHEAGIIHRDLKPSNIMLNSQLEPIIMDFGLARRRSAAEVELTQSSMVLGSPAYMAPEQVDARHDEIGPPTDVYAMGIILYQMVTGRRPYRGSTASIFGQIMSREPDPPSTLCADLPAAVDAICMKAIAKSPSDRHASAAEFAEELSRLLVDAGDFSPTLNFAVRQKSSPTNSLATIAVGSDDASSSRPSRDARRRQLTVMICTCDTCDGEQSLASLDPEDQRDVLTAFQRVCDSVIHRFGGTIVQSTGQELVLCFGYPTAYEDAPHRAIRTGLAILDEMKLMNEVLQQRNEPPLSAWGAIHTGMVVAGELSESESQVDTLSIIGEAHTVTRRLEAMTEPQQIIISDATHRLVHGFFECESRGTRLIRGVSKPIEVFQVLREIALRSRLDLVDPAKLTPLVGREMELGVIKDRWEHAVEGSGQVVLLIGEAGLGKSRLVREIKEHTTKATPKLPPHVIEWHCSPYHEGSSMFPAIEFFERLLGFVRDDSPQDRLDKLVKHLQDLNLDEPECAAIFAALLSIPPDERCAPLELSPIRQKERTQELLLEWLRTYSSAQPVLFVVEDLHWIDPSTLEFLALHVDQRLHHNVLTLLSFRPEFRTPWQSYGHLTQVALTRLTKRQVGEMIQRKTGVDKIQQEIVTKVADRTDGVPLFVEEFTRMVEESGVLDADGSSQDIELALDAIPVTLQDLLAARLDRLESDSDVVQLGATVGRQFNYELLHAASQLEEGELRAELAKLVEAEVLFEKGRPPKSSYTFKHALIQDAAYNSLLKQKRQHFHNKIAETLENVFVDTVAMQPELLAHHYTEAGETEKAVSYWLKAGQHAQVHSANTEAISHLMRGLDLVDSLDQSPLRDQLELGLQTTLAPVLMAARGWSAPEVGIAIERAQQLCSRIGTVADQFFVMWGLWGWRVIRADMDICDGIADDIMRLARESTEAQVLLSEAHWVPGCTTYYKGEFKTALEHFEKGLALVDAQRARAHSLRTGQNCSVMYRNHIALALWDLGFPDQSLQRAEEMLRFAKELNHPFSLAMGLYFRRRVLQFCGRDDQALESIEDEYRVCHENGFVFFEAHAIFERGVTLLRKGKIDEARKVIAHGLEMQNATGGNLSMDHPYRNLAEAFLLAGLTDDANEWLDRGFELVNDHNERAMESEFLRLQGELALTAGDQKSAEDCYQRAAVVTQQQQAKSWELRVMISFAELRQRQGQRSEAWQMLASTYSFFTEGFDTSDLIRARLLLDELGADA